VIDCRVGSVGSGDYALAPVVVKVVGGEMRVAETVSQEIKRRMSHAVGTAGCPIAMTLYYRKRRNRIKMLHDEHKLRVVNKSDTLQHHRQKIFITQPIYSYIFTYIIHAGSN
jgi:hypothetical protein